jgi:hypothetical protein
VRSNFDGSEHFATKIEVVQGSLLDNHVIIGGDFEYNGKLVEKDTYLSQIVRGSFYIWDTQAGKDVTDCYDIKYQNGQIIIK